MKARCPNNPEHNHFTTVATVTQLWMVDNKGKFISHDGTACLKTIQGPDPINTWTCVRCGTAALFGEPAVTAMTEEEFWALMPGAELSSSYNDLDKFKLKYMKLGPEVCKDLDALYSEKSAALSRAAWDAVTGVSDDSFGDLISHVVGLGKTEYDKALANPGSLNERVASRDFGECFSYAIPYKDDFERCSLDAMRARLSELQVDYRKALETGSPVIAADLSELLTLLDRRVEDLPAVAAETRVLSERISQSSSSMDGGDCLANKWCVWNLITDTEFALRFEQPGQQECQARGWYSKFKPGQEGWVRCSAEDPEATEDLNRWVEEGSPSP